MKAFMHWDMEGVSGLFSREQVWYWEPGAREDVARAGRDLLIADVNSACAAAREQFPGVVTANVKRATSHDLCTGLDAESARRLTAFKLAEAIEQARTAKPPPYKPSLPMTVTIRMTTIEAADKAATRPGVRRIDDYTVEGRVKQQCDVVKWINGTGLDMPGSRA